MKDMLLHQLEALKKTLEEGQHGTNAHWKIAEALNQIRESVLEASIHQDKAVLAKIVLPVDVEREGSYTLEREDGLRLCRQLLAAIANLPPI